MSSSPSPSSSAASSVVSERARPQWGLELGGQALRGCRGPRAGPQTGPLQPRLPPSGCGGHSAQEVENKGATASASGQASEP